MNNRITSIEWNELTEKFRQQKCVLFIASEILTDLQTEELRQHLRKEWKPAHAGAPPEYDSDGLFIVPNVLVKEHICHQVREFYQKQAMKESLLYKLCQLPFHLLINLTPDLSIIRQFEKQKFNYQYGLYHKRHFNDGLQSASSDFPILFNMTGSYEEEESLLLSQEDLYEYFQALIGKQNLPAEIKHNLFQAECFLFLGVDWNKWHIRLLIQYVYSFHKNKQPIAIAIGSAASAPIRQWCESALQIHFSDLTAEAFISELHQKCEEAGISSKGEAFPLSTYQSIHHFIELNELRKALQHLKEFFGQQQEEFRDEVLLLDERLSQLDIKMRHKSIDEGDAEIEKQKIVNALVELNREVKRLES